MELNYSIVQLIEVVLSFKIDCHFNPTFSEKYLFITILIGQNRLSGDNSFINFYASLLQKV